MGAVYGTKSKHTSTKGRSYRQTHWRDKGKIEIDV